jgi:hypothetical protein
VLRNRWFFLSDSDRDPRKKFFFSAPDTSSGSGTRRLSPKKADTGTIHVLFAPRLFIFSFQNSQTALKRRKINVFSNTNIFLPEHNFQKVLTPKSGSVPGSEGFFAEPDPDPTKELTGSATFFFVAVFFLLPSTKGSFFPE